MGDGAKERARREVEAWLASYERAWRRLGTDSLRELFTSEATYLQSPYDEPLEGLDAIAEMWEAEREGADEAFTMESAILAVEDDVAVVRVAVHYQHAHPSEYRDLWVIRLGADGRCTAFEEWPFWPGQPGASGA
jgi:SnoaL-like domain